MGEKHGSGVWKSFSCRLAAAFLLLAVAFDVAWSSAAESFVASYEIYMKESIFFKSLCVLSLCRCTLQKVV